MANPQKRNRRILWIVNASIICLIILLVALAFLVPGVGVVATTIGLAPVWAPVVMAGIGLIVGIFSNLWFQMFKWISDRNESRRKTESLTEPNAMPEPGTCVLRSDLNPPNSGVTLPYSDLKAVYTDKEEFKKFHVIDGYDPVSKSYFYQERGTKFGQLQSGGAALYSCLQDHTQEDRLAFGKLSNFEKLASPIQMEVIKATTDKLAAQFKEESEGACSLITIQAGKKMFVANAGDSVTVVVVRKPDGTVRHCELVNTVHNGSYCTDEELKRVQVENPRFGRGSRLNTTDRQNSLEVTRSLGDGEIAKAKVGHSSESEITSFDLGILNLKEGETVLLITASDGFTETIQHENRGKKPWDECFWLDVREHFTTMLNKQKSTPLSDLPKALTAVIKPKPKKKFKQIQMRGTVKNPLLTSDEIKKHKGVIYIQECSDGPYGLVMRWFDTKTERQKTYFIADSNQGSSPETIRWGREIRAAFNDTKTIDASYASFNTLLLLCTGNGSWLEKMDDRSIIVREVDVNQKEAVFNAVLDGHGGDEVSQAAALQIGDVLQEETNKKLNPANASSNSSNSSPPPGSLGSAGKSTSASVSSNSSNSSETPGNYKPFFSTPTKTSSTPTSTNLKAIYENKEAFKKLQVVEGYDEASDSYFYQARGHKFGRSRTMFECQYLESPSQEDRLALGKLNNFEKLDPPRQMEVIEATTDKLADQFKDEITGGACSLITIQAGNTMFVANAGDSVSVIVVVKQDGTVRQCELLNTVHNRNFCTENEIERIKKENSKFKRGERIGSLAVARSLADSEVAEKKVGHSSKSEIVAVDLGSFKVEERDSVFLVTASDGFTDEIEPDKDTKLSPDVQFKQDVEKHFTTMFNGQTIVDGQTIATNELPKVLTAAVTPQPDKAFNQIKMWAEKEYSEHEVKANPSVIYIHQYKDCYDNSGLKMCWFDKNTKKLKRYVIPEVGGGASDEASGWAEQIKAAFNDNTNTINEGDDGFEDLLRLCMGNGSGLISVDDCSIIVRKVDVNQKEAVFNVVLDGHGGAKVAHEAALQVGDFLQQETNKKLKSAAVPTLGVKF